MRWLVILSLAFAAPPIAADPPPPVVVDVSCGSAGPTGDELAAVVQLAPGERVAAVNGYPAGPTPRAAFAGGARSCHREFIDVRIASDTYDRRIVILVH